VTQQNAALVEEAAAAAESLEEQARGLVQTVSMFKLAEGQGPRGSTNLPGPALKSVTLRQLPGSQQSGGLNFDGVLKAHLAWKQKLRDFMAGKGDPIDPAVVERDDKCELGCWIHGDGRVLDADATFVKLRDVHAKFHNSAAKIVRFHLAGDSRSAMSLLGGDFSKLTNETVSSLRLLRSRHESDGHAPASAMGPASQKALRPLVSTDDEQWEEF
jgi:methyl-accepting chemotaxis protein